ncbi:unnamed protein product [Allacma fusca]|uniref:Uncharacterized protein n=1 Tax=Allacma fusca TaxID=39272 RepID=A0A8J2JXV3_9HEXA|nr:unnamed protein product [Allacma fusca]
MEQRMKLKVWQPKPESVLATNQTNVNTRIQTDEYRSHLPRNSSWQRAPNVQGFSPVSPPLYVCYRYCVELHTGLQFIASSSSLPVKCLVTTLIFYFTRDEASIPGISITRLFGRCNTNLNTETVQYILKLQYA